MIMLKILVFLAAFVLVVTFGRDVQGTLRSSLRSSIMQDHLRWTPAGHEFYLTFFLPYVLVADKQETNDPAVTSMKYPDFQRGLLRYLKSRGRQAVTLRDIDFAEVKRFYNDKSQQKDSSLNDIQTASVAAGFLSSICSYCQQSGNQQCINVYCFQSGPPNSA